MELLIFYCLKNGEKRSTTIKGQSVKDIVLKFFDKYGLLKFVAYTPNYVKFFDTEFPEEKEKILNGS